ncbi:MAG: hypothetical protein XD50_0295 [Clostridia bacterium 41_269]|nr:MAG: hypothetical protein XD50_0295 [Clostridia bacterium 41_269]
MYEKAGFSDFKSSAVFFSTFFIFNPFKGNNFNLLKDQRGFLAAQIAGIYVVFLITICAFIMGAAYGVWKESLTKYMYFTEALDFAAKAVNVTGDIEEVELNEGLVRDFFEAAMDEMVGAEEYRIRHFETVSPGDALPGGTAKEPGYYAEITVSVMEGKLPFVGYREVQIPMSYYSVVASHQIK